MQLTTFKFELNSKDFMVALAKSPQLKAKKYMKAEDALAVIEHGGP